MNVSNNIHLGRVGGPIGNSAAFTPTKVDVQEGVPLGGVRGVHLPNENLTVQETRGDGVEDVDAEVERDLTRTDELGVLFSQAFGLPPPPCPVFAE